MLVFDIIKIAFLDILKNRKRAFLTILSISIGIASVYIISTIAEIGESVLSNELNSLGINGILVSNSLTNKIKTSDYEIIKEENYIKSTSPIIVNNAVVEKNNKKVDSFVWGVSSNGFLNLKTIYGRQLRESDIKTKANVCVVDQDVSKTLYGKENAVGRIIEIKLSGITQKFEIVGVVSKNEGLLQSMISQYVPNFIYIPYTVNLETSRTNQFDRVFVEFVNEDKVKENAGRLLRKLNNESISASRFQYENLIEGTEQISKIINVVKMIMSSIASISLIVAGLMVMTIMLTSVSERKREIGIKKAIGSGKFIILLEFIFESIIICIVGAVVGTTFSTAILLTICFIFKINFTFNIMLFIKCIGIIVFIGGVFGGYPALLAAKQRPVDSLKNQ